MKKAPQEGATSGKTAKPDPTAQDVAGGLVITVVGVQGSTERGRPSFERPPIRLTNNELSKHCDTLLPLSAVRGMLGLCAEVATGTPAKLKFMPEAVEVFRDAFEMYVAELTADAMCAHYFLVMAM